MPERRPRWRLAVLGLVLLGLAGCGTAPRAAAPDPVPASARHAHAGPASVTLMTVVRRDNDVGDHASLLIAGAERVIFDPAGSFELAAVPRRHDMLHGISPEVEQVYLGYHARATHDVIARTLPLERDAADALIALAAAQGPASPGFCAIRAGEILRSLPGMAGLSRSPFPRALGESFGDRPGVTTRRITATDVPLAARTRGIGFVPDPGPSDPAPAG